MKYPVFYQITTAKNEKSIAREATENIQTHGV
jgi:hypothetical protein